MPSELNILIKEATTLSFTLNLSLVLRAGTYIHSLAARDEGSMMAQVVFVTYAFPLLLLTFSLFSAFSALTIM